MVGRAIGIVRTDIPGSITDIGALADAHGYQLVHTVYLDICPVVAPLILFHTVSAHAAAAIVVPGFEHIDTIRRTATDLAILITPMRVYPRGYQWPVTGESTAADYEPNRGRP